jgi:UrcA family protein
MTKIRTQFMLLALTGGIAATPVAAEVKVGPETYAVTLRNLDARPANIDAARRTLARIEEAALEVCGASHGSLHEVRRATRKSVCWQESMDATLTKIGNPLLTRLHRLGASQESLP